VSSNVPVPGLVGDEGECRGWISRLPKRNRRDQVAVESGPGSHRITLPRPHRVQTGPRFTHLETGRAEVDLDVQLDWVRKAWQNWRRDPGGIRHSVGVGMPSAADRGHPRYARDEARSHHQGEPKGAPSATGRTPTTVSSTVTCSPGRILPTSG
jgi:hypothetical protein